MTIIRWLRKSLLVGAGLFAALTTYAQQHYNTWFRGTVSIPVSSKFTLDAEFQHRRQSGFRNVNPFDKNLMSTFGAWVHYRPNKNVKISLSPFAYFSNYSIIQKPSDETAVPVSEIRSSAAIELQNLLLKRFYLVGRTAIEYRTFANAQPGIARLRNRLLLRYDLNEKVRLSVFDELFVNVSGTPLLHFFDQNRVGFNVELDLLPHLKCNIACIHIERLPVASSNRLHDANMLLGLIYQVHRRPMISKAPR